MGTIIRKTNALLKGGVYSNAKFCCLNISHPMHRGGGLTSIDSLTIPFIISAYHDKHPDIKCDLQLGAGA